MVVVAFGFLFQNFGRWQGPMNVVSSLNDCRLSGKDIQSLPAVVEKKFCCQRWQGSKNISFMPVRDKNS